jgi:hypothetical protein
VPLSRDLTSRGWIVAKGLMFLAIVAMSGVGIIIEDRRWMRGALLAICLWSACRFYYFLFHVLERYLGLTGPCSGILDLLMRLVRRGRS